ADDSNAGTISLTGVSFFDSFADHETYTFEFTDSTSFSVSGDVVGSIGSGNILAVFVAAGRFTVPIANWSGRAVSGDKWYITASSDMSDDDGHEFIVDATKKINAQLGRIYGLSSNISFYDSTDAELPDAVSYSCVRYAAYDIFHSVYAGIMPEGGTLVENWKNSAEEILEEYISSHGRGPIWKSRESLITELGVEGIGDGIIEIDELSDAKNTQYER
ncbi:MAG: hypothetical protein QG670_849, partial [Thermoproteota archaeon]|nr:hypothetical protein [Thermoproteota archaeon]